MAVQKNELNNKYITPDVYWCNENDAFVASHKDHPNIHGVAETTEEAIQIFYEHLAAWEDHQKQGKVRNKGGRPKKNNSVLSVNISTEAKLYLSYYCIQNDIKPGELINKMILELKTQGN